jgi:hypothetical protein
VCVRACVRSCMRVCVCVCVRMCVCVCEWRVGGGVSYGVGSGWKLYISKHSPKLSLGRIQDSKPNQLARNCR